LLLLLLSRDVGSFDWHIVSSSFWSMQKRKD
jgi:hypothetical protein